jgi:hypothetical protein
MTLDDPSAYLLNKPLGHWSKGTNVGHLGRTGTIAIKNFDTTHHDSVSFFKPIGVMKGFDRRHLCNHFLFNKAFAADLFKQSTFFLISVGAQDT